MKTSTDITLPKRRVLDSEMAYREIVHPDPQAPVAIFLHGNPTSSYIWRHILPLVSPVAHCIAPDLIGFGQSGKPDLEYRLRDHVAYLDAFIAASGLESAYLVAQDWGTALAFHLAARRPEFIRGIAFMEFIHPVPTWDDFHPAPQVQAMFKAFRTPGVGEQMIMEQNVFVEQVLPTNLVRKLSEADMNVYRAPFPTPQSRRPVWKFPNQIPILGEPADVHAMLEQAYAALDAATYPKLLFVGDPGALVSPAYAEKTAGRLQNCRLIRLGSGHHYLQEDHPETIGRTVAGWIEEIEGAAEPSHHAEAASYA